MQLELFQDMGAQAAAQPTAAWIESSDRCTLYGQLGVTDCTITIAQGITRRALFVRESNYGRAEIRFAGRLLEVNRSNVQRDQQGGAQ